MLHWSMVSLLLLTPTLRAEVLQVTSGSIQIYGTTGGYTTVLAGDGFSATGNLIFTGACPATVQAGSPILGCAGFDFIDGELTLIENGTSQQIEFGNNFSTTITQTPMFLSGVPEATLSESATITDFSGCPNAAMFPDCLTTTFVLPQDIVFTISLTQEPSPSVLGVQTYDVEREIYAFAEPNTLPLAFSGLGLFALFRRKLAQHRGRRDRPL